MARRSGASDIGEAFEMFLDTVSNAFGGIVFISLLVTILLQLSGAAATVQQVDEALVARLEQTLTDLRGQVEDLLARQKPLDARIAAAKAVGGDDEVRREFAEAQVKKDKDEKTVKGLTDQADQLKAEIAALEAKAPKDAPPGPTRPASQLRVATAHDTERQQVAVLLSGRRMSFAFKYDAQGRPVAENDADVNVQELALPTGRPVHSFMQKPGAGFLITDAAALERELQTRLAQFHPAPGPGRAEKDCHHIMIAVWPDSYRECELLRDAFIKMKFEYGLLLMKTGEPVRTGGRAKVQ
jgi:hypothetical protein